MAASQSGQVNLKLGFEGWVGASQTGSSSHVRGHGGQRKYDHGE
jgi:hypothetical protein